MYTVDIFTSKNYRQLDGRFQNELIRKMQHLTNASYWAIENGLFDAMPMVEYCKKYPELTRIAWYETAKTFEIIQNYETKEREKLAKAIQI